MLRIALLLLLVTSANVLAEETKAVDIYSRKNCWSLFAASNT